jgi:hypothetical protein
VVETSRVLRRRGWIVVSAGLVLTLTACDHADPGITASVTKASKTSLCITPEDATYEDLSGCNRRPISVRVYAGDCISARVPAGANGGLHDRQLTGLNVLDRPCRNRG